MPATAPTNRPRKVLRRDAAEAQRRLWVRLRRRQLADAKFRRNLAIGDSVADFGCIALRVVVEIEDPAHATPGEREHDRQRIDWFESLGWQVIRVSTEDVFNQLDTVVEFIARSLPDASDVTASDLETGSEDAPWQT